MFLPLSGHIQRAQEPVQRLQHVLFSSQCVYETALYRTAPTSSVSKALHMLWINRVDFGRMIWSMNTNGLASLFLASCNLTQYLAHTNQSGQQQHLQCHSTAMQWDRGCVSSVTGGRGATLETVLHGNSLLERWGGWSCWGCGVSASGQWCCWESPGREEDQKERCKPCCLMVLLTYTHPLCLALYGKNCLIWVWLLWEFWSEEKEIL